MKHFILYILFSFATIWGNSQLGVSIIPPFIAPGGNPTMVQLLYGIFTNNDSVDIEVYLVMDCKESGNLIASATSARFTLEASRPLTINYQNAELLLSPLASFHTYGNYPEYVVRTGALPPGMYEICLTVVHDSIRYERCYSVSYENFTSVNLLTPLNGGSVLNDYPTFTWTRVSGSGDAFTTDIYYALKLVNVLEDQSPVIAMEANPAVFKEDQIDFNLFQYPITSQPLIPCQKYAWQIEAFEGIGNSRRSLAKSEIWDFRVDCEQWNGWGPNPDGAVPLDSNGLPVQCQLCDSADCKNHLIEFRKVSAEADGLFQLVLENKYTGTDPDFFPKSIRIKSQNDSVFAIADSVVNGWKLIPELSQQPAKELEWKLSQGTLPKGVTRPGIIQFTGSVTYPLSLTAEWKNKNGEVICTDSVSLMEVQYYYVLNSEPPEQIQEISGNLLKVQFFNDYASNSDLRWSIFDLASRSVMKPGSEPPGELKSENGQNRISIDLEPYALQPGKIYLLQVSDFINQYQLTFKQVEP